IGDAGARRGEIRLGGWRCAAQFNRPVERGENGRGDGLKGGGLGNGFNRTGSATEAGWSDHVELPKLLRQLAKPSIRFQAADEVGAVLLLARNRDRRLDGGQQRARLEQKQTRTDR